MHPRAPSRPFLAGLAAAALVLGVAGCGDDDEPAATDGNTDGEALPGTIVAVEFSLTDVTVASGEMIVLQNDDPQSHTATSDDEGLFDLEAGSGETSDPGTAPMEAGSYPFHCEIHPSMTATLTVEE